MTSLENQTEHKFISIDDLKKRLGISKITVVRNPNTEKLFAETSNGNFKVQQTLDVAKPMRFMYDDEETFTSGCIVNVAEANVVATL